MTSPFAFEDLPINSDGKRVEPEKWGPKYSKPPKPSPAKPRGLDPWPSNCASGQKYDYSADKHRAKLRAEFTAQAAADRRAWAADLSKEKFAAYAAAPKWKPAVSAPVRKPHFILRAGKFELAA